MLRQKRHAAIIENAHNGCTMIAKPTRKLPNHYRIIHRAGVAGFSDENLEQLTKAFHDTTEEQS